MSSNKVLNGSKNQENKFRDSKDKLSLSLSLARNHNQKQTSMLLCHILVVKDGYESCDKSSV